MNTNDFNSLMLADHGSLIIADADEHTDSHRAIVIREDTVVEEWLAEDGFNILSFYGLATKTLYATDPVLLVPGDRIGAKLELTSGSVWLIR